MRQRHLPAWLEAGIDFFALKVLPASIVVLVSMLVAGGPPRLFTDDKNIQGWWVTGGLLVGAGIAAETWGRWADFVNGVHPEEASRQRVLTAEQELQDALRGPRPSAVPSDDAEETAGHPHAADDGGARALALPELWAVTHSRLDHYHDIATGQARRSFRNAQVAMVLGFTMLAAFVAVALNASTATGSVVAGGLGAVSAALAGYVSRTFVRSQEAAAAHLRGYFDQPLEFSRYLAAERLIQDSGLDPEQRKEVLTALVQAIAAGPQQMANGSGQQPGDAA